MLRILAQVGVRKRSNPQTTKPLDTKDMAYQKVDYELKPCGWCDEYFKPKTSHMNFCSKGCYRNYGKKYLGHSQGRQIDTPRERKPTKPHYRDFKLTYCEHCGFIAKHPCQLDVDHIDGNHKNDDPSNLQTLCANCHRYKTGVQRGWLIPE